MQVWRLLGCCLLLATPITMPGDRNTKDTELPSELETSFNFPRNLPNSKDFEPKDLLSPEDFENLMAKVKEGVRKFKIKHGIIDSETDTHVPLNRIPEDDRLTYKTLLFLDTHKEIRNYKIIDFSNTENSLRLFFGNDFMDTVQSNKEVFTLKRHSYVVGDDEKSRIAMEAVYDPEEKNIYVFAADIKHFGTDEVVYKVMVVPFDLTQPTINIKTFNDPERILPRLILPTTKL